MTTLIEFTLAVSKAFETYFVEFIYKFVELNNTEIHF